MSVINGKDSEKQSYMIITITLYPPFFSENCHFQDNQKNNLKSTEIKILYFFFSQSHNLLLFSECCWPTVQWL